MPRIETIFDDVFLDSLVVLGQYVPRAPGEERGIPDPNFTFPQDPSSQKGTDPLQPRIDAEKVKLQPSDFALANKLVSHLSTQFLQGRHQGRSNQPGKQEPSTDEAKNTGDGIVYPFNPESGIVSMRQLWNFAELMDKLAEDHKFNMAVSDYVRQYMSQLQGIIAEYSRNTGGRSSFGIDVNQGQYAMIENFIAGHTGNEKSERDSLGNSMTIYDRSINAADAASRGASICVRLLSAFSELNISGSIRRDINIQIEYGNKLIEALRNILESLRARKQDAGRSGR